MQISSITDSPAAIMADMAPASAHEPSGYATFSTLHPTYILPDEVRIDAPTLKDE
jgi:hypothetical protein